MDNSDAILAMMDAFDNGGQGLAVWDPKDNLTSFNINYKKIFTGNMHFSPEVGLNFGKAYADAAKNPKFTLDPENTKKRIAQREQARLDKKPIESEYEVEPGKWLHVKETASNDGHMITVLTDVTVRKTREIMQSKLADAIDAIPSHVMFWDEKEKLVKANKLAVKENLEYGVELHEGMSYAEFLSSQFEKGVYSTPPDFSIKKLVKKRLDERKELTSKSRKVHYKNGRTLIRTENKLDQGGILTILNDVTELEQIEAKEKQLSSSLENMSYAVALWDKDNKLVRFNEALRRNNEKFGMKTEVGISFKDALERQVKGSFYNIAESDKKDWINKGLKYWKNLKGEYTVTYQHPNGQ